MTIINDLLEQKKLTYLSKQREHELKQNFGITRTVYDKNYR